MLLSTITSKVNRFIAPKIIKHGLTLRFILSRGEIHKDTPLFDAFLLLPLAQKLLSVEIQDIAKEHRRKEHELEQQKKSNQPKSQLDGWVDQIWDKYLAKLSPPPLEGEVIDKDMNVNVNTNMSPRLRTFEEYVRPILTPTDEWSDVERWRFHARFTNWLRKEYLICKYDDDIRHALASHSKLRVTPLLMSNRHWVKNVMSNINNNNSSSYTSNSQHTNDKGEFAPLPSGSILDQAFQMKGWNKAKSPLDECQHMRDIAIHKLGGSIVNVPGTNVHLPSDIPYETSLAQLTLEEVLEVTGCHVSSCSAFNALCDEVGIYEFWTEEYVKGLAAYLVDRCRDFDDGRDDGGETIVVDVGAGDGTLVHFLNAYMSEYVGANNKSSVSKATDMYSLKGKDKSKAKVKVSRGKKTTTSRRVPTIIATDSGDWKIQPKAHVEQLSITEAMKKYSPLDVDTDIDVNADGKKKKMKKKKKHQLIVICSWMPWGIDWTQTIRDHGADEYILIGECDDGNCGHNWLTFGNEHFRQQDEEVEDEDVKKIDPPYEADGFERFDLEDLSSLQYSRYDSKVSGTSKTISFRRRAGV